LRVRSALAISTAARGLTTRILQSRKPTRSGKISARGSSAMLTKDVLFGMNILTLAGLLLTAFGLTLRRMGRAGLTLCIGVMGVGTVLVLAGLLVSGGSH
jgi:hypothetical protein